MNELYFYYSCGHRELEVENRDDNTRLIRCVDDYCDSCLKKEYLECVKDYAKEVDELTEEEWEALKSGFFKLAAEVSAIHPDWKTDAVALEIEKQQLEARGRKAVQNKELLGIPRLVLEPAPESAKPKKEYLSEWVEGSNDEIFANSLQPLDAWLIIEESAVRESVSSYESVRAGRDFRRRADHAFGQTYAFKLRLKNNLKRARTKLHVFGFVPRVKTPRPLTPPLE